MHNSQLSEDRINKIKNLARIKLEEFHKLNDVIGAQIFSILEKEGIVLYYPLEDLRVWGFSETIQGKSFVCINTSLSYDKQVFVAAHELYHLWFDKSGEIIISTNSIEPDAIDEVELMANRFAAEFLVSEELLRQEIDLFNISKENLDIKNIVKVANHFVVPYRTMVKRFNEIGMCTQKQYEHLLSCTETQITIWENRIGISIPTRKESIGLYNLVDKAMDLFERKLITYEKMEYLLRFSNLTPENMGIKQNVSYTPPTDEELDGIMEE
jgi:Zn-dependent peptidase ImmA (M78 family)